jgi:hypothetical protein
MNPSGETPFPSTSQFKANDGAKEKAIVWRAWDVAPFGMGANKIASKTHPEGENATP